MSHDHKSGDMELPRLQDVSLKLPHTILSVENSSTPAAEPAPAGPYNSYWPMWAKGPLFWFPHHVNGVTSRFVAGQAVAVALIILIARESNYAWYLAAMLMADYGMRMLFGGRASVLGAAGEIYAAPFARQLVPGAPKQFAALIGFLLAGGTTCALWEADRTGNQQAAAVMMGVLAGAAFLEFLLDFCLGCFMYRIAVYLGLFSAEAGFKADSLYTEDNAAIKEWDGHTKPKTPVLIKQNASGLPPYEGKQKVDAWHREDFHLIRNVQASHFIMAMGCAGLACLWKVSYYSVFNTWKGMWTGIAIASAVVYCLLLVLYIAKCVYFPYKVWKEWEHPIQRNGFGAITLTMLLFSYLCNGDVPDSLDWALFWVAGPLHYILSCFTVARWIKDPMSLDWLDPSWMIIVVGNLVAAFVFPVIDKSFTSASWLWYASGLIFGFFLLFATLQRHIFDAGFLFDDRRRPALGVYIAFPSMACLAYVQLTKTWDSFAFIMFYLAVFMFCVVFCLFFFAYLGRSRFDMAWWSYVFPLDVFAINWVVYHNFNETNWTNVIAVGTICIANAVTLLFILHTTADLIQGHIFVPAEKFGPLSFMRLCHEAFYGSLDKLNKLIPFVADPAASGETAAKDLAEFARELQLFKLMHDEHSAHEDLFIYPSVRAFFPNATAAAEHEHGTERHDLEALLDQVNRLLLPTDTPGALTGDERKAAMAAMEGRFRNISHHLEQHLLGEELNLQPIHRKYLSLTQQKQIVRSAWLHTTPENWRRLLPWIVQSIPIHGKRIRFLRTLQWAVPEHFQTVGHLLYPFCDAFLFERLAVDCPEIVPRHVPYWKKSWL